MCVDSINQKMSKCNLIVCLQPVYMRPKSITALSLSSSSAEKSALSHLIIRLTSPRSRTHIFTTHNSHNMRPAYSISSFRRSTTERTDIERKIKKRKRTKQKKKTIQKINNCHSNEERIFDFNETKKKKMRCEDDSNSMRVRMVVEVSLSLLK